MNRCTGTARAGGRAERCIRELGHSGDHHYAGLGFACDSCGRPVEVPGRFRCPGCPPPPGVARMIADIRDQLRKVPT